MTGTAELVAEEMLDALEEDGHEVEVEAMDDLDASVFEGGGIFLICTSTYGQGDVPDNAMKLFGDLKSSKPDLSGVRYGVFSLGDRTYADTFNFGGIKFDELLKECGAKRIGEISMHDASAGTVPEEEGVEWVRSWMTEVGAVAA
jgi:MioC protein